ncbi:2-hydroxyacid dehydrogenase [Salipaludibacillus agaradhaerens]|nr:D-glycerate dehydrogenase [Salipaludibacillus agaradhaerens]
MMEEKPYVFVTRKVPVSSLALLEEIAEVEVWPKEDEPVPYDILKEKAKKATGLFTMLSDRIDAGLLAEAKQLKVVANLAVGFDNIDIEAATEEGVVVCHTPDVLSDTTADLTFALLMAVARRIVEAAEYVKKGDWKNWAPLLLAGHDIHHKTIGIVGMGRIGTAVAKRAKGFDMTVLYHNRKKDYEGERTVGATYVSFDELVSRSDFIVCLAPLTNETINLFTYDTFKQMKESAIVVNVSRGAVIVEEDLEKALENNLIAGAGLDVFKDEPISNGHPLLRFPNVVALPHIGSASKETREEMASLSSQHIINVLKGTKPEAIVNDDVWKK